MNVRKTLEGEEHLRLASKALKTGVLKWTPDYDTAGDEYSRAATAFKIAKEHRRCLDSLSQACECYKQIRSLFQAAKMLEQAVLISRDMGELENIRGYGERGALLYRQAGYPESAVQLLKKSAKLLEMKYPNEALGLYFKAAETVGCEDRPKEASEYMARVAQLQVRTEQWDEAVETLKQTIFLQHESGFTSKTGRLVCGLVLVHLAREDSVAASKAYNMFGGYCDPDLSAAMHALLNAFEEEDPEEAKAVLNKACLKDLDIEFTRMLKKIKLPDSGGLQAAAADFGAKRAAAINLTSGPSAVRESFPIKDDDDEDDLC